MKYRNLGKTDIKVSVIAMGCWAIVGDSTWGQQDENESVATIETALDAGVNFFDTAEAYGNGYSESILGKVLARCRNKVVIATKVSSSHLSGGEVQKACESSLIRLNTDYIDLYQIHFPNRDIHIAETIKALEDLKRQGKIRAIGTSNFGVEDLSGFLSKGHCQTNQLPYNLLWRAIEYEIKQECIDNNVGILCYSPIAQGLLTGKFASAADVPEGRARTRHFSKERPQTRHGEAGCEKETFTAIKKIQKVCERIHESMADISLSWLLHQPGVTSVLAGARNPEQIKENVKAAEMELTDDAIRELTEITEEVKLRLGKNPDMWQSESRMR